MLLHMYAVGSRRRLCQGIGREVPAPDAAKPIAARLRVPSPGPRHPAHQRETRTVQRRTTTARPTAPPADLSTSVPVRPGLDWLDRGPPSPSTPAHLSFPPYGSIHHLTPAQPLAEPSRSHHGQGSSPRSTQPRESMSIRSATVAVRAVFIPSSPPVHHGGLPRQPACVPRRIPTYLKPSPPCGI